MQRDGQMKIGDRVGAVLSSNNNVVKVLGFGVFSGYEKPPEPPGYCTFEEYSEVMREQKDIPAEQLTDHNLKGGYDLYIKRISRPNPKLTLDDGRVVWGFQCWWGPESEIKKRFFVGGVTVLWVDLESNPLPSVPSEWTNA